MQRSDQNFHRGFSIARETDETRIRKHPNEIQSCEFSCLRGIPELEIFSSLLEIRNEGKRERVFHWENSLRILLFRKMFEKSWKCRIMYRRVSRSSSASWQSFPRFDRRESRFSLKHEGRVSCQGNSPSCSSAASFYRCFTTVFSPVSAPNSPLHLSNRAHVLLLLNRPQASLTDADHAVRMRPDWGKVRNIVCCGHFSIQRHRATGDTCKNNFLRFSVRELTVTDFSN